MNATIFDKRRPLWLRSANGTKKPVTSGSRLQEFSVKSEHTTEPMRFVAKVPDKKYAELGIRLYGPEWINVTDLGSVALTLKSLGINPKFDRFYFNTLYLIGKIEPKVQKRFRFTEKIERALSLKEFKETSIRPLNSSGFKIEYHHCDFAVSSDGLLRLNQTFYGARNLDRAWMEKQYIRSPEDNQKVLLFLARAPDNEIVGFADAILNDPNKEVAMQRNTFVAARHRNLGIGSCLKNELIRFIADTTDKKWVVSHNDSDNLMMSRISKRFGFRTIQEYIRVEGHF